MLKNVIMCSIFTFLPGQTHFLYVKLGCNNRFHRQFFLPNHVCISYLKILLISDFCTISLCLFEEVCFFLCLQTVDLVSQASLFLFHNTDHFHYSSLTCNRCCPENRKGLACEPNLSFKKVTSCQDTDLENRECLKWSRRRQTNKAL